MKRVFCSVGIDPFATVLPAIIAQQGLERVAEAELADIVISDDRTLIEHHLIDDAAKMGILCLAGRPVAGSRWPVRTALLPFTGCRKKLRRDATVLLTPAPAR